MNYISMTDLRTKSPKLKDAIKRGEETYLVNRSEVIAVIKPIKEQKKPKVMTKEALKKLQNYAKIRNLPYLTYEERESNRQEYVEKKYGKPKDIS